MLGPDLPWADSPGPGTLGFSAEGILTPLSLLISASALVIPPVLLIGTPSSAYTMLFYHSLLSSWLRYVA